MHCAGCASSWAANSNSRTCCNYGTHYSRTLPVRSPGLLDQIINLRNLDLKLIDYFAVAMLIFMRSHLVGHDYNRCMKRLFKFPPVDDVSPFVQTALRMYNEDNTTKKDPPPPAAAVTPTPKPAAATSAAAAAAAASKPQQPQQQSATYMR